MLKHFQKHLLKCSLCYNPLLVNFTFSLLIASNSSLKLFFLPPVPSHKLVSFTQPIQEGSIRQWKLEVTSSMLPEVGALGVEMAGWFSFSDAELSEVDWDTVKNWSHGNLIQNWNIAGASKGDANILWFQPGGRTRLQLMCSTHK